MGCLELLLQKKLLVLPKRILMLVTENRAVYLKYLPPVLLKSIRFFKEATSHFQKPLLMKSALGELGLNSVKG